MTPDDLDAIVTRAASVYPEDAGWDGDEAERALTTVTRHVPALAAALREAWAERDGARVASTPNEREAMLRAALDNREACAQDLAALVVHSDRRVAELAAERDALRAEVEHLRGLVERASAQVHAVAEERDAAEERAWAHAESRDATRAELDAMTRDRNEANRQRVVAHKALDAVATLLFVPLRDLGYDRAAEVLCSHVEELYRQRTAARDEEYALAAAYARADALQAQVATLTQERDAALATVRTLNADIAAAAGELLVPIPTPGSDAARILRANILMRRERDEARAERRAARLDRDAAEERVAELQRLAGGQR